MVKEKIFSIEGAITDANHGSREAREFLQAFQRYMSSHGVHSPVVDEFFESKSPEPLGGEKSKGDILRELGAIR